MPVQNGDRIRRLARRGKRADALRIGLHVSGSARILDVHGREIEITMRPLAAERREKLIAAVHTAYRRLKEPNEFGLDKEMFAVAVRGTGYVETDAEGVGPFAATGEPANPITILHRHSSLWENETELCVAVLHEAVHWLAARAGHKIGREHV